MVARRRNASAKVGLVSLDWVYTNNYLGNVKVFLPGSNDRVCVRTFIQSLCMCDIKASWHTNDC